MASGIRALSSAGPKGVFADVKSAREQIAQAVKLLSKQDREIKTLRKALSFWDDMVKGTCLSQGDGPKDCISEKLRLHREKVQAKLDAERPPAVQDEQTGELEKPPVES